MTSNAFTISGVKTNLLAIMVSNICRDCFPQYLFVNSFIEKAYKMNNVTTLLDGLVKTTTQYQVKGEACRETVLITINQQYIKCKSHFYMT